MSKIRTIVLFGVVFILAVVLATTAYIKAKTPAAPPSTSVAAPVKESVALAPISINPGSAQSAYMSEAMLRRLLDQTYEHTWDAHWRLLLSILNGHYEHRCCGLPR